MNGAPLLRTVMSSNALLCQQCHEPVQLDASLVDLAPSAYDTIIAALPPSRASHPSALNTSPRLPISPASTKSPWPKGPGSPLSPRAQSKQPERSLLPNESFVLLQDSVIQAPTSPPRSHRPRISQSSFSPAPDPSPMSNHLRSADRLFNLISARTDIDHPLCAECTQILRTSLQKQLDEVKKERDGYLAFEKEIKKERDREAQSISKEEAERKISKLIADEQLAIEQLREAEREREQLDHDLRQLEQEEQALELEEDQFWRSYNDQLLAAEQQTAQLATLRAAYAADSATLDKLERTNVYNDAFCIGHDGVFGTINGLRLGRVPGVPVDWAEINAAWGQTLLLLYTVARKLDFTFENYRLIPMGSFSRIERTSGDKAVYELYGSGDLHLGRLLHNRRFDIAMVAFLDCLKQMIENIKSQDPEAEFHHQIAKDKIGDVSVKLQFNQEEAWTRSLRHVLLALKMCLRWTTNNG